MERERTGRGGRGGPGERGGAVGEEVAKGWGVVSARAWGAGRLVGERDGKGLGSGCRVEVGSGEKRPRKCVVFWHLYDQNLLTYERLFGRLFLCSRRKTCSPFPLVKRRLRRSVRSCTRWMSCFSALPARRLVLPPAMSTTARATPRPSTGFASPATRRVRSLPT